METLQKQIRVTPPLDTMPRTVPDVGTLAIFSDAEGAVFGAIHRDGGDPEDYLAEPGEWIWIQLLSRDSQGE